MQFDVFTFFFFFNKVALYTSMYAYFYIRIHACFLL